MDTNVHLHWGDLPKELRLLLSMIGQEDEPASPDHAGLFHAIDWNHFLELVKHHRVFPLVYKKIRSLNSTSIPPHVVQNLQQEYKLNTFEMLRFGGEMERLCRLLSEASIPCLFLKGPVLAMELYGDLSLRSSCDLDILVPLRELDRAEELLLEQGYVKDDYFSTTLDNWKWRHHHTTYTHPQRGITVELHWRLNPGPSIEPSFEHLWERRRVSPIKGVSLYFLGREDLFLFLILHGSRHGWSRLRWLADIDRFVKQAPDWDKLYAELRTYDASHIAGQALHLCAQLLHTPQTEAMALLAEKKRAKKLANDAMFYLKRMVNLHTDPVPDDVQKYHKRHLFALMGIRQKLLFIVSFLHPYPIDAEILPLPKKLHFLYFPLRPVLWFWRTTKKYVVSGRA